MKIVYTREELQNFTKLAILASPGHPVLIDKFLEDAVEVDVDAISDGKVAVIGGVMEHIEAAGVHSGDSACVLPPITLKNDILDQIARATKAMAAELGVVGLMNVQYAIKDHQLFVLEVNPRASRTIPFVSKATGIPLAKLATKVMLGISLDELGFTSEKIPKYICVKEAVLPFNRFPDVDTLLGPEMKSTGEVMGIDAQFGVAYAKAQLGAGQKLPTEGAVFISVKDSDKEGVLPVAFQFRDIGFQILSTSGTSAFLKHNGIANESVAKVSMGRPNIVDAIKNGKVQLIINTGSGDTSKRDGYAIRRSALKFNIPYATTISGAMAVCRGVAALKDRQIEVETLQAYHSKSV
jgi:carbamoyl-phosphate synthase large subunit